MWNQANDFERWKMLPRVGGLLDRDRGFPFDYEGIEIFAEQDGYRL